MGDIVQRLRDFADPSKWPHARDTDDMAMEAADEIERLRALHAEIVGELYGQGFEVIGWHDNGDAEELDNWFKTNGWCEPDKWTLPKAAEAAGGDDED